MITEDDFDPEEAWLNDEPEEEFIEPEVDPEDTCNICWRNEMDVICATCSYPVCADCLDHYADKKNICEKCTSK